MGWPVWLTGLGASLAINAYRTLKLLALGITVRRSNYPLCGLPGELRFITGNNILEKLELDVWVNDGASCRTESEDWSAFDSVLTQSGAFPMLHQVSVRIWWDPVDRLGVEVENGVMEILKEDKLPRLVESKAVEFNFSADTYCCPSTWFLAGVDMNIFLESYYMVHHNA